MYEITLDQAAPAYDRTRKPRRNAFVSLIAAGRAASRSLARRHQLAKTRRALLPLDHHALRDIGLTRADLYGLASRRLDEVIEARAGHLRQQELAASE
jgi:uncharacterized protein YjiS (DUF1127 family)